jgi:hypothetical protein
MSGRTGAGAWTAGKVGLRITHQRVVWLVVGLGELGGCCNDPLVCDDGELHLTRNLPDLRIEASVGPTLALTDDVSGDSTEPANYDPPAPGEARVPDGYAAPEGTPLRVRVRARDDDDTGSGYENVGDWYDNDDAAPPPMWVRWAVDGVAVDELGASCPTPVQTDGSGWSECLFPATRPIGADATRVTLTVYDSGVAGPDENFYTSRVVVFPIVDNATPVASLVDPAEGQRLFAGRPIPVSGLVSDTDASHPVDALTVAWLVDGLPVGTAPRPDGGGEVTGLLDGLSEGTHRIGLSVEDPAGADDVDERVFTVEPPNDPPSPCAFEHPDEGGTVVLGTSTEIRARVSDPDQPANELVATLTSSVAAQPSPVATVTPQADGTVRVLTSSLVAGPHLLTLTVTDPAGDTSTCQRAVTVSSPPTLTLTSPTAGQEWPLDTSVVYGLSVSDPEDAPSALTVRVRTDVDGELFNGPPNAVGQVQVIQAAPAPGPRIISVEVEDSSGLVNSTVRAFRVGPANRLPTAPGISILPSNPRTDQDLVAQLVTPATDADGDSVTYRFAWFKNGSLTPFLAGQTLAAEHTTKGDLWSVTAIPNDGTGDGPLGSASVVVANSAPLLSGAQLPSSARAGDTLVCVPVGFSDADGDTPVYAFAWTVDTVPVSGTSATFSGTFRRGDVVGCAITVSDGDVQVGPVSAAVTVSNTLPTAPVVALGPTRAGDGDLICDVTTLSVDGDGDAVTYDVDWTLNGAAFTQTLDGAWPGDTVAVERTRTGQVWTCRVTPADPVGVGGGSNVASVTLSPGVLDGSSPTRAARSCAEVGDNQGDPVNADYWIHPTGDFTSEPDLEPCLFDRHVLVVTAPGERSFQVPPGVEYLTVKAWGAGGGFGTNGHNESHGGGAGGFTNAVLPVVPAENLALVVGQGGPGGGSAGENKWSHLSALPGNGGPGSPGMYEPPFGQNTWQIGGGGGGGFTGVFRGTAVQSGALVVAGGGGGGGECAAGGTGGGLAAGSATGGACAVNGSLGGGGATATTPGTSTATEACVLGLFPNSGHHMWGGPLRGGSGTLQAAPSSMCVPAGTSDGGGGGGGGGFFGGGGGHSAWGTRGGGGGGGSGYIAPSAIDGETFVGLSGTSPGLTTPDYALVTPAGQGSRHNSNGSPINNGNGGDGALVLRW